MRHKIITLCGSTKYKDEFLKAQEELTLQGNIVLTPGVFSQADNRTLDSEQIATLVLLHKEKILISDRIHVINVGGYIGFDTIMEILFARQCGKEVTYLEERYIITNQRDVEIAQAGNIPINTYDNSYERFKEIEKEEERKRIRKSWKKVKRYPGGAR